eukprot:6182732-Pleurochrysis_carterae.AAC.2
MSAPSVPSTRRWRENTLAMLAAPCHSRSCARGDGSRLAGLSLATAPLLSLGAALRLKLNTP